MLSPDFLDFIDCLNKNEVAYVLVGGYAAIIKGHNRTTGDLDIFVERKEENAAKVIKAIDDFGFGSIGFTAEQVMDEHGFMRMGIEPLRIDILSDLPGVSFDEVYKHAEEYEDEGIKMKVIHISHLIQNKIAVGRPKDIGDVRALEKILKKKKMSVQFSEEKLSKVKELISHYPEGKQKSAILPVLHIAQDEFGGWLDIPVMDYVASLLDILPIEVYEVATFYSMLNTKPVGKYLFEVCQTGPCMLNGSDQIIDYIKQKLGIREGETTTDGLFTLKPVECLGACGYAPMMQLGKTYREHLTKEKIDQIIEELRGQAKN